MDRGFRMAGIIKDVLASRGAKRVARLLTVERLPILPPTRDFLDP